MIVTIVNFKCDIKTLDSLCPDGAHSATFDEKVHKPQS